jgi:hypothetical protein
MSRRVNSEGKIWLLSRNGIALFPENPLMEPLRARVVVEPFSLPDGHARPQEFTMTPAYVWETRFVMFTLRGHADRKGKFGVWPRWSRSRDDILLGSTKHVVRDEKSRVYMKKYCPSEARTHDLPITSLPEG